MQLIKIETRSVNHNVATWIDPKKVEAVLGRTYNDKAYSIVYMATGKVFEASGPAHELANMVGESLTGTDANTYINFNAIIAMTESSVRMDNFKEVPPSTLITISSGLISIQAQLDDVRIMYNHPKEEN